MRETWSLLTIISHPLCSQPLLDWLAVRDFLLSDFLFVKSSNLILDAGSKDDEDQKKSYVKMRCSNLYCACGPQGVLTTPWMVGSDFQMSEFSQSCPAIFTFPNYQTKEFNAESCLNVTKKLGSYSRLHQYSVVLKLVA